MNKPIIFRYTQPPGKSSQVIIDTKYGKKNYSIQKLDADSLHSKMFDTVSNNGTINVNSYFLKLSPADNMNKLILYSLTIISCLITSTANAQTGYNYKEYEVGVGVDFNSAYADAQTVKSTRSARLNFTYNATPFVNYVVELQTGNLQGGDALTTSTGRQFSNDFTAGTLRGQIQAGEILDYSDGGLKKALKNLYLSSGIGVIVNNIKEINRFSVKTPGFFTDGDDKSKDLFVPFRIGYEFKIYNRYGEPGVKIDLAYQYNYTFGEGLDGFTAGNQKDTFRQFGISIKYAFGSIATYRKQIAN